jgi:hypothetical protein
MHDLDLAQSRFEFGADQSEADGMGFEFLDTETSSATLTEEAAFDEVEEMELAGQLLEVADEAELDQFLGNLVKKAWKGISTVGSKVARPLGGVLKTIAKKTLPILGGAVGTYFGGPAGGMIGSQLAAGAGKLFGLELEGMSPEDQKYEVAQRFVRFAGVAARQAAQASPSADSQQAIRTALMSAARKYAPGLVGILPSFMRPPEGVVSPKGVVFETEYDEVEEVEQASQLLQIADEAELDQFLGGLVSGIGRAVGGFFNSGAGRALTGTLKNVAGRVLPHIGGAIGGAIGGPAGRDIGTQAVNVARSIFGFELESAGPDEQRFELGRRFIRLARAAARRLAQTPATGSPQAAARAALLAAARQYAPGLIRTLGNTASQITRGPASGRGFVDDAQEAELSARLLEITDEAELDQFLGGLVSSIGQAASGFLHSAAGQALTSALKDVAGQALPAIGGALGGAFGGTAGRDIGSKLGSAASSIFGLEMEGVDEQEQDQEFARRFIRLARAAARRLAQMSATVNPQVAARAALMAAARQYAPGLVRAAGVMTAAPVKGADSESPFSEAEEMELAASLLGVTSEGELDQFLGNLINKAGRAISNFARSDVGRTLGGVLKQGARIALPAVGGALGTLVGGPAGGMIGGRLASAAGSLFGLELEGLSPEDQEFEVARRFVRFAGTATRGAAQDARRMPPRHAVRSAVITAARRHAPGLIKIVAGAPSTTVFVPEPVGVDAEPVGVATTRQGGRWVRQGRKIVLFDS